MVLGLMVVFLYENQRFLNISKNDQTVFEQEPLMQLAKEGKLLSRKHEGFWECMDTLRDKTSLCEMWDSNNAPWKRW